MALMTKDRAEWMKDYALREKDLLSQDPVQQYVQTVFTVAAECIDRHIRESLAAPNSEASGILSRTAIFRAWRILEDASRG